jgi:hypothetical protein
MRSFSKERVYTCSNTKINEKAPERGFQRFWAQRRLRKQLNQKGHMGQLKKWRAESKPSHDGIEKEVLFAKKTGTF